jgi:predicted lipase
LCAFYWRQWKFPNAACNEATANDRFVQAYRAKDTAFGYVVVNDVEKYILAAFKGSNSTQDWLHDANTPINNYPFACVVQRPHKLFQKPHKLPGKVHAGFCGYYRDLVDLGMTDKIASLAGKHPDYRVLLTGHSLGGAAAALCAADLITRFNIVPTLYTFGEPRVGDHKFASTLTKHGQNFRIVHRHDIVPHLAPCCAPGCLKLPNCPYHHSTEIWYKHKEMTPGDYITCSEGDGEDSRGSISEFAQDLSADNHIHYFGVDLGHLCRTEGAELPK